MVELLVTIGWVAGCGLAYFYRGRGIFAGRPVCAAWWSLPILVLGEDWWSGLWYLASFSGTWVFLTFGHGSYFDLSRQPHMDDESIEPVLNKLGIPQGWWYDAGGMYLTGMLNVAPAVIIAAVHLHCWPILAVIPIAGAVKPVAYELAWRIFAMEGGRWGKDSNPIGVGELLFGTGAGAISALALYQ